MFRTETKSSVGPQARFEVFMKPSFSLICLVVYLGIQLCSTGIARPIEISPDEVGECTLLGKVTGSSGYGKNPSWEPIAKTYAAIKAEKLGATHQVLVSKHQIGAFNGEVVLDAYDCPRKVE